jgi:hypothetical protein
MNRLLGLLCCIFLLSSLSPAKLVNLITDPNNPKHPVCAPGITLYDNWVPSDNSCTFSSQMYYPLGICQTGDEFSDRNGNVGRQQAVSRQFCGSQCCCWAIYGGDIQVVVDNSCKNPQTAIFVDSSDCTYP